MYFTTKHDIIKVIIYGRVSNYERIYFYVNVNVSCDMDLGLCHAVKYVPAGSSMVSFTMAEIKAYYGKFAEEFVTNGFEETLLKVKDFIRMYYSCDMAVLQMIILLMNHITMVEEAKRENLLPKDGDFASLASELVSEEIESYLLKNGITRDKYETDAEYNSAAAPYRAEVESVFADEEYLKWVVHLKFAEERMSKFAKVVYKNPAKN